MNKKSIFGIILLIVILVVSFVLLITFGKKKTNFIEEISVAKLQEKIKNKDTFVLVITQTGCSHCENYKPILKKVGKEYDFTFYDINLTKLDSDEYSTLTKIANSSGTPTTIFFEKGEEQTTLNRLVGETSESKLIDKLVKLNYIKE